MGNSYWADCINEAFSDAGIDANNNQIKNVIQWVEGAHENYGMATGSEFIPSPIDGEIERLNKEIERLRESHDIQINGVIKGVANRTGLSESDISIDANGVFYYRR